MTPEKQRIAIAKVCGVIRLTTVAETLPAMIEWLEEEPHPHSQMTKPPWCEILKGRKVPDYLTDLNAMHEAEQFLNGVQQGEYAAELDKLAFTNLHEDFALIHATAAQRAEAFLKTIGKLKEESK